jgi:hypothetical protein
MRRFLIVVLVSLVAACSTVTAPKTQADTLCAGCSTTQPKPEEK